MLRVNLEKVQPKFEMKKNIIEKIWETHVVSQLEGQPAVFAIDLHLIHEVTSAQAFQVLEERGLPVFDVDRSVATLDHSIPTRANRFEIYDDDARLQVATLRENVKRNGIPLFDFDSGYQGIVHVIGPELGLTQPGMTIVCGDSHTSTHGAFGALAFGIGTSEVAHVLATGCLLLKKPKTMKVEFCGEFRPGVFAKDAIMKLIAEIGISGANGHIIEYCGDAVRRFSMEERMTVCNMSIECGARAGLVSPDDTTFNYLAGRRFAPTSASQQRAEQYWRSFVSDPGCAYDREVRIDLSGLAPMVTWGTNPEQAVEIHNGVPRLSELPEGHRVSAQHALEYVGLKEGQRLLGVPVDWAFVGSCTNGRIEDLRLAASVLKGRKVHPRVTMYVVPGSEQVLAQLKAEGLDRVFEQSGAELRLPGCSMCLGMNDDKVPAGKRCISSSNRNFVGRQGAGSRTHLASPVTVAASAVAGVICGADDLL